MKKLYEYVTSSGETFLIEAKSKYEALYKASVAHDEVIPSTAMRLGSYQSKFFLSVLRQYTPKGYTSAADYRKGLKKIKALA